LVESAVSVLLKVLRQFWSKVYMHILVECVHAYLGESGNDSFC
jgi:hypothetical protein